ncbi:hypothetical protein, partial [Shinella sp. JR1-6]|uniref:hypothetical protein n=1 Tax=Shinella sp. JR1-6 TaxID=2527671 RepID=UPI001A9F4C68
RSAIRRMMFKSPMWITPLPPSLTALGEGSHGSILNGNYAPNRLSSAWKPTGVNTFDYLKKKWETEPESQHRNFPKEDQKAWTKNGRPDLNP